MLGKIIGTRLLPRLQLTPEAERPVGRQVAGFCPQRNGAAGKVAHKIHQCHGTVHGTVGVGGGVVEQNVVRHHGIVMAKAPQPHPHPGRVALAADAALHLHGHRAAVVDLGTQVGKVHPGLPAGVAAAACGCGRKGRVGGAAGGHILHDIGHLFGQDILAPAVHQGRHDQRQIHLPAKAGVVGVQAVFRQVEPPVQRVAVVLFPGKGPHRHRQQPHRRGHFIVVGGKVHLQLHTGAAAGGGHRHGVPHQEDHAVLALGVGAAPGVIRCPLAKAHPAGPGISGIHPAPHLHHGVVGGAGVPAHTQVAERRHGKFRSGVAAVLQAASGHAVQHKAAVFQRKVVQLPAGKGLGALQDQIVALFHHPASLLSARSTGGIIPRYRPPRRRNPRGGQLPARHPSACGCSPRCGTPGPGRRTRSDRTPR